MVLSGPEGKMKPNAEKDLLEGDKECWNPDREILAGHSVSSFEDMFAREEAEDDLKAKSQLPVGRECGKKKVVWEKMVRTL